MKRDDLKEQGLNETQINFVMSQNGKDINALNEKITSLTNERDGLQSQIADRDNQLNDLKKSVKDNDALKDQIKQLQEDNKTATQKYQDQLASQSKSFKIEGALRDAKAKNIKTVLPLIDTDKVSVNKDGSLTGLSEQIDAVKKDNSYLFDAEQPKPNISLGSKFNNGNDDNSGSDDIVNNIAQRMQEAKKSTTTD